MLPGADHVTDFADAGLGFGSGSDQLRIGHAKIMVSASTGVPTPSFNAMKSIIHRCASLGFPVAVHAVEADVVRGSAQVFAGSPSLPKRTPPHRIEHCSEAPPDALTDIAECGASIVTQPGFVHHHGDRYLAEVSPTMHDYLYRAASLAARGIVVAFSSDAPVSDPNPMPALHAATTRRTSAGSSLGGHEAMGMRAALSAYTLEPARVIGADKSLGTLTPGSLADMVLFAEDLTSIESEALVSIQPVMTILGGQIVAGG